MIRIPLGAQTSEDVCGLDILQLLSLGKRLRGRLSFRERRVGVVDGNT